MFDLRITASSGEELKLQLMGLLSMFKGIGYQKETGEKIDTAKVDASEIKPVISMEQMEANVRNAPVHEMPKQPSIEEVRTALKELRERKGAEAVRELLKAFGAESLTQLDESNYLGALARAKTEV